MRQMPLSTVARRGGSIAASQAPELALLLRVLHQRRCREPEHVTRAASSSSEVIVTVQVLVSRGQNPGRVPFIRAAGTAFPSGATLHAGTCYFPSQLQRVLLARKRAQEDWAMGDTRSGFI